MTSDARAVREAAAADMPALIGMLGAAFQDEPVMAYIFPDPAVRRARLPRFFAVIAASDRASGACFMTAGGEAATLWRRPGHGHPTWGEKVRQGLPWILASGSALGRALAFSAASDANHPKRPHWYLHVAGCEAARRGRGLGGAAIRAGLARADRDGVPAYLETATASNLPLYQGLGFAVTHEWSFRNGPLCWSMLREPGRWGEGR